MENDKQTPPDGSTDISEEEARRTEALGTGAPNDATDPEADTASGGPADANS